MAAAGVTLVGHIRDLGSIGPREALAHLWRYYRTYARLVRSARQGPVDAAILLDFPDFNLPLARKLRRMGVPVVYYISPQLWAWRRGRVRLVRRYVNRMLVILPFEEAFYRERGVAARFVGHPLLEGFEPKIDRAEHLARWGLDPGRTTIAVLPGSRSREVEYILPVFLEAGRLVAGELPVQFVVSAAPTVDQVRVRAMAAGVFGTRDTPVHHAVVADEARDILANCDFGWVKSGTSTLEAALTGTPFLIAYRLSAVSWWIGNILIRSPYKGLVNLIARDEIVPELMQSDANPPAIAAATRALLGDAGRLQQMRRRLGGLRDLLGAQNASETVAQEVRAILRN